MPLWRTTAGTHLCSRCRNVSIRFRISSFAAEAGATDAASHACCNAQAHCHLGLGCPAPQAGAGGGGRRRGQEAGAGGGGRRRGQPASSSGRRSIDATGECASPWRRRKRGGRCRRGLACVRARYACARYILCVHMCLYPYIIYRSIYLHIHTQTRRHADTHTHTHTHTHTYRYR